MSRLSISLKFLSKIHNVDLYKKLIEQLNKDFYMAGILEEFSLESKPQELVCQLQNIIINMINNQHTQYSNLLYRIDVPEQSLKNCTNTDSELTIKQHVYLILKREWQKVYFKNKL